MPVAALTLLCKQHRVASPIAALHQRALHRQAGVRWAADLLTLDPAALFVRYVRLLHYKGLRYKKAQDVKARWPRKRVQVIPLDSFKLPNEITWFDDSDGAGGVSECALAM